MSRTTAIGRAERLVAGLLPLAWPSRAAALDSARRLDDALGDAASDVLLQAFAAWRATLELPSAQPLHDLVTVLADLLGSAPELRLRPRGVQS